ncbi:MAG: hypothetical protein NTV08_20095 [Verrucomicrobia bacterium]|nr:hypothetical protein [Verrucomicrobiota bacterium]
MKKILSLLMCYVFLQAETFALRGGPTGAGAGKVTGSFSGIMLPANPDPAKISADVGLFIMSAAISGPSVGYLIIFSQGETDSKVYNCKMTGLSDTSIGGSGTFYGLFAGTAATGAPAAGGAGGAGGGILIGGGAGGAAAGGAAAGGGGGIAGQMTARIDLATRRLTGTAVCNVGAAAAAAAAGAGAAAAPAVPTPLKTFTLDGWQTADSSSTIFSL